MATHDQKARDRMVRRLINGKSMPALEEVLKLCPYRTPFARSDMQLRPDTQPTCIVVTLGFKTEDFSDRMRADILTAIHSGEIVGLVSNRAELRDYAKRELALALTPAYGTA